MEFFMSIIKHVAKTYYQFEAFVWSKFAAEWLCYGNPSFRATHFNDLGSTEKDSGKFQGDRSRNQLKKELTDV